MPYNQPIYNSRITKVYLEYLKKNYPDLDIEPILEYAGIAKYEIEDPAHWFSQEQSDRFHERIAEATKDPNISRKAGRYAISTEGFGAAKQYVLGLLNLSSLYLLIGKAYLLVSRGASISAKKLRYNKIRIISTPKPGVDEKPYQCEYRIGIFESMAKLFIRNFAHVEHPECIHKGHEQCRYIITWDKKRSLILKQIRNILLTIGVLVSLGLIFVLPLKTWGTYFLSFGLIVMFLSFLVEYFGHKEMTTIIEMQGKPAEKLIAEMRIRHDHALLVQEIGTAISSVFDVDKLVGTVMRLVERHIDFDRGIMLLADNRKTHLSYVAGYGYEGGQESSLRQIEFNLDNPDSQGVFVLAFRDQKPFLVENVSEIEGRLSKKSVQFMKDMGVHSLICVPIIYKNKSLGILAVDKIKSERPMTTSDINLLMGVASQTAVGIMNAISFQKIQESEKKYRDLVENANSIIMRIDIMGNITFFNEYAQRVFGYTENEIIEKKAADIFHPVEGPTGSSFSRLIEELTQYPEKNIFNESKSELESGEMVWIAWTCKPICDKGNAVNEILCIGNDITVLKQTEREKEELETRLLRAHKMEAIGTLAGGVAHDLNNILSGIVSYPEILLIGLPQNSPLRKPVLTIQKSGKRAAAIVQDLLTLARRGVVTKDIVNLNSIIREYLQSPEFEYIQGSYPGVRLKTNLPENLFNIIGSPVHLSKTVMNLVTNALEATNGSGEVIISTENRYVDKLINGYDQVRDGDYVTLSVIDTGIGISPKDLERIFEPFYTNKVMGKSGTGLGMAVVWGTVKDHNGYVDLKSTEGQGTSFTLYFPAVRLALPDMESKVSCIDDFMGKGESILVVDDVEDQRDIASEMLSILGYTVQSVSSGEEAVAYLQKHSADLIVLDMIMGSGMDGLDTYRKILQFKPDQKAIITSGFAETKRVKEALHLGVKAYIKKPYLIETIGKAARAELNNE